jgi:hypothetical protein
LAVFGQRGKRPVLTGDTVAVVGEPFVLSAPAPSPPYEAVFEDDGETGYFYGLDTRNEKDPVLDALHVYNVADVTDRAISSRFQVVWTADGTKTALFVNDYPHAVFDFVARRGYCRTNFPPPASGGFSVEGHEWDEAVVECFL